MTTTKTASPTRTPIPPIVRRLDPIVHRLARLGLPMGPNVLLTVRGRKSGELRTTPVAILETGGRQYLFSAFGEVQWVANLRAAGEAEIRHGRRRQRVLATEIAPADAAAFLEAGLRPVLKTPILGSMIGGWYGIDRGSTAPDYLASARQHPAFELRPAD